MIQLLIVFPSIERGGAEEYALTIACDAKQQGWQVHAAFPKTPHTTSLIQDFQQQKISYHCLEIVETHVQKLRTLRQYLPDFLRTIALLLKLQPDAAMLVLPWPDRSLGTIFACGYLNLPTVVVFQLVPFQINFSQWQLKLYDWSRTRNQQWIAVSEFSRNLVSESFKMPVNEVACIYNGTKLEMADNIQTPQEIALASCRVRQELGLPSTSRLILTVGRLSHQKGHSDIIANIPSIIQEFPEVKFIWVGDGELREQLQQQLRTAKVEASVRFLGYRTDVPQLLQAADLFLFPTRYEGQPFALLEAMAHGLPVVASDASSIPEIIADRCQGLLFRTGDREDLLAKLSWALQNPALMQEMAETARMRVRDFSANRMTGETLSVLQQLLKANPNAIHNKCYRYTS